MAKDLELLLEQMYYESDNVVGKKLLDKMILESFIEESRGMLFRDASVPYEKDEVIYRFAEAKIIPPTDGAFKTDEEFDAALKEEMEERGIVQPEMVLGNKSKAAMLIFLVEEKTNRNLVIVKYYRSVSPGKKWQESEFEKETGFVRVKIAKKPGAVSSLASSQVEGLKIKPVDLVGDSTERAPEALAKHILKKARILVKNKELDPIIYGHLNDLLKAILKGDPPPTLKGGAKYASAYNNYLGEIIGPIAFVKNWQFDGDVRAEAEEAIFKDSGLSFSQMNIFFNDESNEGLIDSSLKHPTAGNQIFISSKAGKGASSSLVNFQEKLKELVDPDASGRDKKLAKANKEFYKSFVGQFPIVNYIIETVKEENWWDGPIKLAMNPIFGLLEDEDKKILDALRANMNMSRQEYIKTFKKTTPKLAEVCKGFLGTPEAPKDPLLLKSTYRPSYHLIAAVAKAVASKINENGNIRYGRKVVNINFDAAVKMLLNKFGVLQINSKNMKIINNTDCQLVKFVCKYPSTFKGTIIADAGKSYWATGNNGKMTFKIP